MKIKKHGEEPFSILKNTFAISPSKSGYTLAYSADGQNSTNVDKATPANENLIVTNVPEEIYFKCVGNTDEIIIKY